MCASMESDKMVPCLLAVASVLPETTFTNSLLGTGTNRPTIGIGPQTLLSPYQTFSTRLQGYQSC